MEETRTSFKERLTALREEHGLTKSEAAQLMEIAVSTYSNWEYGVSFPRPDAIRKIAKAFDVTTRWLETGLGEKTSAEAEVAEKEIKEKKKYEAQVVYSKEDETNLESINMLIKYLPTMNCPRSEKRKMHATLSKYRAELESKVLFGVGSINGM